MLYFSYGGIFHRLKDEEFWNAGILPIAFLVRHKLLSKIDCYYPFDTGAAKKGLYDTISPKFRDFDLYKVSLSRKQFKRSTPKKLVHYVYGGNQNFLKLSINHIDKEQKHQVFATFPELLELYSARSRGFDHRSRVIECQSAENFTLIPSDELVWLGYPNSMEDIVRLWCCRWEENPTLSPYEYIEGGTNPHDASHELWTEARKFIAKRYL